MERPLVIDYWAGRRATQTECEAEVERLQTDMIDYIRGATYMTKQIQGLRAENALLRAELESFYYPRTALLKDLAELDKDEEGER